MTSNNPSGACVFCVGVGNEVNRPLLRQIAEQAGGIAAFASQGDDFSRQARAFRRDLPGLRSVPADGVGRGVRPDRFLCPT